MPKKLVATVDEVNESKAELERKIAAARAEVEKQFAEQLSALESKLRGEVQRVQGNVDRLDEVKVGEDSCDKVRDTAHAELASAEEALRGEIQAIPPMLEDTVRRTRADLEQHVAETDTAAREAFAKELETLCVNFDQELQTVRSALEALVCRTATEAAEALQREHGVVEQLVAQAREEAANSVAEAARVAAEALQHAREDQEKIDGKQDQKLKSAVADIDFKIADVEKDIQNRSDEAAKALREAILKAEKELAKLADDDRIRFEGLDADIAHTVKLFSDVENVPTRKLDWVIREADSRLRLSNEIPEGQDELPAYGSWTSPQFDIAGARGLTLELRHYRLTNPPAEDQHRGDLAAFLHAPEDTHIAFKLSIGKVSETFEHKFRENEPLGTRRLGFLKEQLDPLRFTLSIGIEILECIYIFTKQPDPPKEAEAAEGEEDSTAPPPLDAFFRIQRHVNNRVLDQVKQQVDYFRTRMIRRIEWRLEEASQMKRLFPRGAPMRSKHFDAAGIEGMFLVFYPSGYDSAQEGNASAFLYAPAGTTLRCWLQVGMKKRELNHTFEKEGHCGRANFVRFEEAVDQDEDCVHIALQIEEAHMELSAHMHHPPPPQAGCRSLAKNTPSLLPLGSTVKLQRNMEHLPDQLQEVKILPSLWATRNYHDVSVKVEGLRPIKDIRLRQQQQSPPRSGTRRSPSSPLLR